LFKLKNDPGEFRTLWLKTRVEDKHCQQATAEKVVLESKQKA
jgi:hypothetical protein